MQVVELARLAPDTFPLDIVDFSELHPEEVAALTRQHGALPEEELFQPFWVQLSRRLLQWHLLMAAKPPPAPAHPPKHSVLYWEVQLRPLLEGEGAVSVTSPSLSHRGHAYVARLLRRQVKCGAPRRHGQHGGAAMRRSGMAALCRQHTTDAAWKGQTGGSCSVHMLPTTYLPLLCGCAVPMPALIEILGRAFRSRLPETALQVM